MTHNGNPRRRFGLDHVSSLKDLIEVVMMLSGTVGPLAAAVRHFRKNWTKGNIALHVEEESAAILYYLTHVVKPSPDWRSVERVADRHLPRDQKTVYLPSCNSPVSVGNVITVTVMSVTVDSIQFSSNSTVTKKTNRLEVRARTLGEAERFIKAAVDAYADAREVAAKESRQKRLYIVEKDIGFVHDEYDVPPQTFANLIVPETEHVKTVVTRFMDEYQIRMDRGERSQLAFMLHGLPGCGKSSMVNAIANAMNRSIIVAPMDKLQTGDDLRAFLQFVETELVDLKNAVVVFEDCDTNSLFTQRRDDSSSSSSVSDAASVSVTSGDVREFVAMKEYEEKLRQSKNLSTLLNWLDGPNARDQQVIVFTTNDLSMFDHAFIRPGRMECVCVNPLDSRCVQHYYNTYFGVGVQVPEDALESKPTLAELAQLLRQYGCPDKVSEGLNALEARKRSAQE